MAVTSEDSLKIEFCPNFHNYLSRWFRPLGPDRDRLRGAYGHIYGKYVRSYQKNDENFISLQESGMQAFVKMQRKLLRRMRVDRYNAAGARAMKSLGAALCGDTNRSNIVLVSMDFEFNTRNSGLRISEIGFATLHCEHLLSEGEGDASISASNFTSRSFGDNEGKFMFGESIRFTRDIRCKTIVDFFSELSHAHPKCEVILIGHSIHSEMGILDDLGISLEALSVTGTIDTCDVARNNLGFKGNLGSLLTRPRIPSRSDLLHCAGNDAHYSLQALLAILQTQYEDNFGQLERLARPEIPTQPCCLKPAEQYGLDKSKDNWIENLELEASLSMSLDAATLFD